MARTGGRVTRTYEPRQLRLPRQPSATQVRLTRQYGRAAQSSSGAGADGLAAWFFLAVLWSHVDDPVRITVTLVLVLIPLAIASTLVHRCTAWRVTDRARCEQRRFGLFRRCADHAGQVVTVHDVAAVFCVLVAVMIAIAALAR